MKEKNTNIAKRYGFLETIQKIENEILEIDGVSDIDFDLDGFYDDIFQVIIIPEYSIPVSTANYFEKRKQNLSNILDVCAKYDLKPSGDRIEDHGSHWYIVRNCGETWKK